MEIATWLETKDSKCIFYSQLFQASVGNLEKIMKVKFFIATVASLIVTGSSFAQSRSGDTLETSYKPTLSHAQVVEELRNAQANSEIVSGELYGSQAPAFISTLLRADVVNESKIAQLRGEILSGELWGQPPTMLTNTHTRLEIRGEAIEFAKAHHGHGLNEIYSGD